ncbi:hypothetical protein [Haloarcula sp. CBA1127]|uniref:hypothetical protein n=1 Tax=Haloarcula sp. CBA1127 TaxID=1765055 RepID=UPI000A710F1E|nr:hypothetical protein [Haloarcula sp. CBA1127]
MTTKRYDVLDRPLCVCRVLGPLRFDSDVELLSPPSGLSRSAFTTNSTCDGDANVASCPCAERDLGSCVQRIGHRSELCRDGAAVETLLAFEQDCFYYPLCVL